MTAPVDRDVVVIGNSAILILNRALGLHKNGQPASKASALRSMEIADHLFLGGYAIDWAVRS